MARKGKKNRKNIVQQMNARRNSISIFQGIEEIEPFPICFDSMRDAEPRHEEARDLGAEIYFMLRDGEYPGIVLDEVREALKKHPTDHVLKHYEIVCLRLLKKDDEAEKISQKLFDSNPDYLYARIALAEFAMEKGNRERVLELLGPDLSLRHLYPTRKVFHATEAYNFYQLALLYHMEDGTNLDLAAYLVLLRRLDVQQFNRAHYYKVYKGLMDTLHKVFTVQNPGEDDANAPILDWGKDEKTQRRVEEFVLYCMRAGIDDEGSTLDEANQ